MTPLSLYNQKTVVSIHMTISAYSGCLPNSALTHLLLLPLIKLFEWYKSLAITPKVKEDNQCNPKRYYHTTSRVSPSPSSSSSHARFWIESSLCSGLDATINFSCGMQYQLQPGLPPLILVWQSNINYSPAERMFSDNRHPKAYLFHPPTLIHSISASYSGIFIPVKVVTVHYILGEQFPAHHTIVPQQELLL